jgi:hypothetical protein
MCHFVQCILKWIANHNYFQFEGTSLEDIWVLDALIPYKNITLVEMIRGAVLWTIWLERNILCFQNGSPKSVTSIGIQILSLVFFWCQHAHTPLYTDL